MKTLSPDKRTGSAHRLAIIDGHLKKVRAMVEQGAYCIDIIHQSQAIQQALKKFDEQILQQHLTVCVARDMKTGTPEKVTGELIEVFKRI
jgi:DNA-binding FrmR family transcriptional regulator